MRAGRDDGTSIKVKSGGQCRRQATSETGTPSQRAARGVTQSAIALPSRSGCHTRTFFRSDSLRSPSRKNLLQKPLVTASLGDDGDLLIPVDRPF